MVADNLLTRIGQAQTLSDLDNLLDNSTLAGNFNGWLLACIDQNFSKRTIQNYREKVGEFLRFIAPLDDPHQLSGRHLFLFQIHKAKTCKPWTVHDYHRAIKTFCNYMVEPAHVLKVSPMAGMKRPKLPKMVIQPYSQEQIKMLLELCDDTTFLGARNKALLLLFISSSLRKEEMAELQLKDINIASQTIKVMGKGAKERVVGFGVNVKKAIMVYYQMRKSRVKPMSAAWLWVSEEGNRLQYGGIYLVVYDLCVRAGIKGSIHSVIHALRHTFATQMLRNGPDLKVVQSLMGHSTPDVKLEYAKTVNCEDAVLRHPEFDPVDRWKL